MLSCIAGPALATAAAAVGILFAVRTTGLNVLNLLQAGAHGPSATVIRRDFPGARLPDAIGHDGQQFYAVARQPMHWAAAATSLDRPLYRLQRPLLPWLAWLLHPQGGGPGLVVSLFVVGAAGALVGGTALAVIASDHGRSPWWGAVFPVLPGCLVALRITTSDTLAVALALAAVCAAERNRRGSAIGFAVAAVLAKEVVLVVLIGHALARRWRPAVAAATSALAATAGLALSLRLTLGGHGADIQELGLPFAGLSHSIAYWSHGGQRLAALTTAATAVAGAAALWRRRPGGSAPSVLWLPTLLCAAYLLFVTGQTMTGNLNGPRTLLPLLAMSLACLLSPEPRRERDQEDVPGRDRARDQEEDRGRDQDDERVDVQVGGTRGGTEESRTSTCQALSV